MEFSDPSHLVEQFGLNPGMHVADLGAGSGHYAMLASEYVGKEGKIYAVDIQQDLVNKIKNAAKEAGKDNIEVIWGDLEEIGGTKLRESSMHAVVVSNVLFQVEDKQTFVKEVKRVLRPNGRAYVIDWSESFGGLGPHKDHVVSEDIAKSMFDSEGMKYERELTPGAHHYGFVYKKV